MIRFRCVFCVSGLLLVLGLRPAVHHPLMIRFRNCAGNRPLQLSGELYSNSFGEPFSVQQFKYYVSAIRVTGDRTFEKTADPGSDSIVVGRDRNVGEEVVESYSLNAVDYLLKPYTFARFQQAIEKAETVQRLQQNERQQYLILRVDYSLIRIALPDILFIEGLDNYLKVHVRNQSPIVVRMTMKALQEKLPDNEFVRVHRS